MRAVERIFMVAMVASAAACTNLEERGPVDARLGFSEENCTFVGPKRGVERPTWQFFAPGPRDGAVGPLGNAEGLARALADRGYDLARVRRGEQAVPRFLVANLPHDLPEIEPIEKRKALFFAALLPAALYVNEKVSEQRRVLEAMQACEERGHRLDSRSRAWLRDMADIYDEAPDVRRLLVRVDVVPPSLLLAQAAIESAWGASRFVRQGNALFGEYTYRLNRGLLPAALSPKARFRVRNFADVVESVISYVRNLNTHPAYGGFRQRRAEFRAATATPTGHVLAGELVRYSARRQDYVRELRAIIRANELHAFDDARLARREARDATSDV